MAEATLNGPVIGTDKHNVVLRSALFASPAARAPNPTDYVKIEVGTARGAFFNLIGSWNQQTDRVNQQDPIELLDPDRINMRLSAGQILVVKLTTGGTPDTVQGAKVTFRLSLVGGRTGELKPLVAGAQIADPATRDAIALLQRQINTGGLAEWDESVALVDLS